MAFSRDDFLPYAKSQAAQRPQLEEKVRSLRTEIRDLEAQLKDAMEHLGHVQVMEAEHNVCTFFFQVHG